MHSKGLPCLVRIGGFDVSVTVKDRIENGGEPVCFGLYDHERMTIELKTEQPNAAFAVDTFMHEVGHAIFVDRDLRREDDEERIVGQMSRGYTQVLRDNPEVLKWLIKSLG